MTNYKFLQYELKNSVATVTLNNHRKANSLNEVMWREIKEIFQYIDSCKEVNVCIIKANGKHFSSGIDINFLKSIMEDTKLQLESDQKQFLKIKILEMQESFSAISNCKKPVIAAIHGLCIGAGVDLIAACDLRYSLYSSHFSIMETKLGIVADMGTLQRLPRVISDTHLKELALTSRVFSARKAKEIGLLNGCTLTRNGLYKKVVKLAREISELPMHAVQGTKQTINYSREMPVSEGLEYIGKLNSVLLNAPEMEVEMNKLMGMFKK